MHYADCRSTASTQAHNRPPRPTQLTLQRTHIIGWRVKVPLKKPFKNIHI
jgi:hypothetical protein